MIRPKCDVCGERALEVVGEITRPDRAAANWCRNCGTYYADIYPESDGRPFLGSPTIPRITTAIRPLIAFVNQQAASQVRILEEEIKDRVMRDVSAEVGARLARAAEIAEREEEED